MTTPEGTVAAPPVQLSAWHVVLPDLAKHATPGAGRT